MYDLNTIAEGFWYVQGRLGLLEQVVAKNKSAGLKPASVWSVEQKALKKVMHLEESLLAECK